MHGTQTGQQVVHLSWGKSQTAKQRLLASDRVEVAKWAVWWVGPVISSSEACHRAHDLQPSPIGSGRVRIAVRLRPQNSEETVTDADLWIVWNCNQRYEALLFIVNFKIRVGNSDTYEFDEVLTKFASQKQVYEVVTKRVVEIYAEEESRNSRLTLHTNGTEDAFKRDRHRPARFVGLGKAFGLKHVMFFVSANMGHARNKDGQPGYGWVGTN
ncbi:kinesin-like protein KIN-UB [Artemisia annua]|uniref:Kinesin-like protein KIN-UB n=1 Tax=Artemisia annua TaxID=35608 RepID=A0A2U1KYP0_ARTAN|nr:kinesin-like protein KIN-UB [Artemisia annua]